MITLLARAPFGWRLPTTLLGLACSIPPFATLWFEHRQRPVVSSRADAA